MNHLQTIHNVLSSTLAIPVGAVQMAQAQALPFCVFDVDVQPEQTKAQYTGIDVCSVIVGFYHNELSQAQVLAQSVRNALTSTAQTGIQSASLQYISTEYINEVNAYALVHTYQVRIPFQYVPESGIGVMAIGSTFIIS